MKPLEGFANSVEPSGNLARSLARQVYFFLEPKNHPETLDWLRQP